MKASKINAANMYNDTILVSPGVYGEIVIPQKNLVIASLFVNNSGAMELYNVDAVISSSTITDNQWFGLYSSRIR